MSIKIIHTSDWHIGRTLYGRKRYEEFEAFFNWLAELLCSQQVGTLLVAGDIFDNNTPSNRALQIYYRFLCRIAESSCRHVVITAGNHDSPSLIDAPRELLKHLDVHVIGCADGPPADEVLVLNNSDGEPELIVCAVPHLRDRDIRTVEAGESIEDKEQKLIEGIRTHYQEVCGLAKKIRSELMMPVPLVAMGHLFTSKGQVMEGDGVRELYVGSLAHVEAEMFPWDINYLALGHLHLTQMVNNSETMRYSGSPLPMGFAETADKKNVLLVEFSGLAPRVTPIAVPSFRDLKTIRGNLETILSELAELKSTNSHAWIEVVYEANAENKTIGNLRELLDEAILGTNLEILRIRNNNVLERALISAQDEETLADLDVHEVFARCMDMHEIPQCQRPGLLAAYQEALTSIHEDDSMRN